MGRPLRKDVFGTDAIGTFTSTASGIKVRFHDGSSLRTDGVIIKQRGAKTFTVCRVGDIGTTSTYINAVLKNGTPSAAGEMQLIGYTAGGPDASATNVAKITKRVITDFSGARYTWFLDNDSSGDQIIITAL